MADRRKLQGEIDRCLKKVDEGVETFEDIWKKVQAATNTNQKEKFESDLKKEIKKLQRLRDQIKSWLANSDIKDKSSLLEKRKLIETQMERFKVVERETKTKAYSKDGLGAAAKVDPQTKEKVEVTGWLSNVIDSLQVQLDQFESEMESRSGSSKKKNKDSKYEELKQLQDRHKYHIETLEKVMRHVDNDKIPLEQVKFLQEDLEYFVESNQDPSFQENQYLYDDLDLEGVVDTGGVASSPPDEDFMGDKIASTPSSTNSSSPSPSPSANSSHSNEKHDDVDRKRHKSQSEEKGASPAPNNNPKPAISSSKHSQNNHHPVTPSPLTAYAAAAGSQPSSTISSGSRFPQPTPSVWQRSLSTQSNSSNDSQKSHANSNDHSTTPGVLPNSSLLGGSSANTNSINSISLTSSGNPSVSSSPSPLTNAVSQPTNSTVNSSLASIMTNSVQQQPTTNGRPEPGLPAPTMNGPLSAGAPTLPKNDEFSLRTMAQQAVANAELEKSMPLSHLPNDTSNTNMYVTPASTQLTVPPSSSNSSLPVSVSPSDHPSSISTLSNPALSTTQTVGQPHLLPAQQQAQQQTTNSFQLNPFLGMAPLGPGPITKDQMYQLAMLEAAYHHLPHPSDSERMRNFLPRNPCPTPAYYPSAALHHADSVEFYSRCGTETLFFIFYYMEGTKAQYLAAKALKKQSWRFHTKYMMWFQRYDEPKQITEEFEQGTYIYFDYEKWGQKRKEAFIFEYRYLEDRDLN